METGRNAIEKARVQQISRSREYEPPGNLFLCIYILDPENSIWLP
jgi:hypothetical protein